MSKEKQILQLRLDGFSQRRIADTLKVSRNTVARVVKACDAHPINKQELQAIDESKLHQHLFPEEMFFASTFCRKLQVENTECCIMENP